MCIPADSQVSIEELDDDRNDREIVTEIPHQDQDRMPRLVDIAKWSGLEQNGLTVDDDVGLNTTIFPFSKSTLTGWTTAEIASV